MKEQKYNLTKRELESLMITGNLMNQYTMLLEQLQISFNSQIKDGPFKRLNIPESDIHNALVAFESGELIVKKQDIKNKK